MIPAITPIPKYIKSTDKKITLGKLGEPCFKIQAQKFNSELAKNAVKLLCQELDSVMNISSKNSNGTLKIKIEISDAPPAEITKYQDQAYHIEVNSKFIKITGYGEAGLYYAVNSFIQLIYIENNSVFIPELILTDYPDLKTRGHFIETRYGTNLMTFEDWKSVIDDMTSMKLNQLVISLYGCWVVQYDGVVSEYIYISLPDYPLLKTDVYKKYYSAKKSKWINEIVPVPMAKEDFFGKLVKYGKSVGVEVLPLWNSYGHNTLIPTKYPEVAPMVNGEKSKLGFCISAKETYDMLFNIYDYIIDKYLEPHGIKSFHIGLDEVYEMRSVDVDDVYKVYSPWCECPECTKLSNQNKIISHAIKLIKHLKERGMENIYIYNDLLSKIFKDPKAFKDALTENDLLDVTIVDWWAYSDLKENMTSKTTYPELGFRSTVKPWNSYYHWNVLRDVVKNIRIHSEMAYTEHAEGMQSYASWDKTCDINHTAIADYSWNHIGTGSVEDFRNSYAKRKFGARYLDGKRAVDLFAKVTEFGTYIYNPDSPTSNTEFGYGEFVKNLLAYYSYTYVGKDLPYPRNFPGEPIKKLLDHREFYEEKLLDISALSKECANIFTSLSKDMCCDFTLARRYACEMLNYHNIVEDYIALFAIKDIVDAAPLTKESTVKISEIARIRKTERISLMAEMEEFKEEYLIPSHLRNQSIFMQLFADIEAYVNTTNPEEIKLDICDLSSLGSKTFYDLR